MLTAGCGIEQEKGDIFIIMYSLVLSYPAKVIGQAKNL